MELHLTSHGWHIDKSKETQYSDAWALITILFMAIGYIAHVPTLLTIGTFMLALALLSWAWHQFVLQGVYYQRHFAEKRAFVGEEIELTVTLENHKLLPVSWLRLKDDFPETLPIEGADIRASNKPNTVTMTGVFALRWFERVERHYTVKCARRGYFPFGPAELEASDPFGFFAQKRSERQTTWFIIYPKVLPLTTLGLPAKNPFGELKSDIPLFPDPTRSIGVRDYQPGDALRAIHWKATARRQQLQTKVLEPVLSRQIVIFLNVSTLAHYWKGVIPRKLERAVSVAASVANYAAEQRWPVGLMANGTLPRADQPLRVPPGRAPGQLTLIMEMLAAVTPVASMDIDRLLMQESSSLPWGATLVVVTAYIGEALLQALHSLQQAGRKLTLIALTEEPPAGDDLHGITVYHLPGAQDVDFRDVSGEVISAEELSRGLQIPNGDF